MTLSGIMPRYCRGTFDYDSELNQTEDTLTWWTWMCGPSGPLVRLPLIWVTLCFHLLSRSVHLYTYLSQTLYTMPTFSAPSLNALRIRLPDPCHITFWCLGPGLFLMRSGVPLHSRGITEPGFSTGTPSCCTGDLITFFEDKSYLSDSSLHPYSPLGH